MADEIEIINVGGDGVASDATLKALISAVEKMGGSGSSTGAKVQELHNQAVKSGIKVSTQNRDALEQNTKSVNTASKATSNFANKMKGAMFGAIGAVTNGLAGIGNELLNGGSQLGDFTQHIPVFGTLFGPFVGYLDRSIESFRQLSSVGASFNNSIEDMRRAAATSGMTLDEYTGFVSQNAEDLRLFGSTVQGGALGFTRLNKELKKTGQFNELKELGFSVMEINESLVGYASLQQKLGRLQGQSTEELAVGAGSYLKELDKLAKVTGKSREELEKQADALAADASFRAMANKLQGEELQNFTSSMQIIESIGGSTAVALKDLADGVPQTEEAIALIAQAGPEVQYAMERVAQGADPQILIDALGAAGEKIDENSAGIGAAGLTAIRTTNAAYGSIADEAYKLRKMGEQDLEAAQAEQDKRSEVTAKLATFDDAVRGIRETIQVALLDSGVFDLLGTMVTDVVGVLKTTLGSDAFKKSMEDISAQIKLFLEDVKNIGIKESIQNLFKEGGPFEGAFDGIKTAFKDAMISGAPVIVAAIAGVFAAGKVVDMIGSGIKAAFGMGGGDSGGKSSKGGKGGKGGGGLGKALGGLTGGLLSGLAKGIAAFANPAIPLGAAALGAAIVAIGAGIAGAAWLTGKALPTFSEGLQSFESLDGDKLAAVGKGVTSLGVGLVAFGAGSVASAIGGITDMFAGFLGADSPADKIADMAEKLSGVDSGIFATFGTDIEQFNVNLDADKISNYADAIEKLAESFEELNEQLAEKNNGFGESGVSVASTLGKGGFGGSGMNEDQINQLNSSMSQSVALLSEIKELNKKQLGATRDMGDVY